MKHLISILLLFVFSLPVAFSQEVLENNPPSVKFYKINTPHFKVLYPKGFEEQAQRMANTLEHIYEPEATTLQVRPRKIPVILQNQSALSNGFVSLLPRRSEFYTMPPQDYNFLGTNDWLDQLATHEYRHVVQFQRVNTGFNRLLHYAFGPAMLAAMATTSVPQWVWEGDAVATETAFTNSGRGRIPNFGLLLRTNLQEGRVFNYNKQYLRSYRHNISDHYVLGYHMIGYLRKKTNDPEVWGKIMKRTAQASFLPYRFSGSVKKIGGLTLPELYRATAEDLQQTWNEEQKNLALTSFETITSRHTKAYTSYSYPQVLSNGDVLALKTGIGDIARFTLLREGKEIKSFTPGLLNDAGMLSAGGSKVVWCEYGFDPRWRMRNYSVIKSYDTETKAYKVLTRKTRYAGAALSPDGSKVVTVESKTDYQVALVIINSEDGGVVKTFSNPENAFYSMARWSDDGKKIVALKTLNRKRSVITVDVNSGEEEILLAPTDENIGHPVLTGNLLLFNSPVSGIDNIYAYDPVRNIRLQVTSAKYGAYNPVVSNDRSTLFYNNQSRDGLDVVSIPFTPQAWKVFEKGEEPKKYDDYLSEQEGRPALLDSVPANVFETTRYSKISGIFNPYSWGVYTTPSLVYADVGISSQDVLSTIEIKAGYLFDINERTGSWRLGVSYQGWYPIIDAQILFGNREDKSKAFGNTIEMSWQETSIEAGLRLPWVLTKSKYYSGLELGNYFGATNVSSFLNTITYGDSIVYEGTGRFSRLLYRPDTVLSYVYKDKLNNGNLFYNRFYATFYRQLKRSARDIYPRFAQVIEYEFYKTFTRSDFEGKLWAIRSAWYFPGFAKHHSIYSRLGYQLSDQDIAPNYYNFRNRISKPRGHVYPHDEKFFSFSVNYTLPLWYPDIAIGPFLNFQRVRANLFYDYGAGKGASYYYAVDQPIVLFSRSDATYKSFGTEVTFDINVMRYLPKFEIGFRATYRAANQYVNSGTVIEFLIGNIGF